MYKSPAWGSRPSSCWTCSASVFMPRRMSVTPAASHTRTPPGTGIIALPGPQAPAPAPRRQPLRRTGRRGDYRQKPAAGPLAELPAPGEHLIGIDVMTPGNHRDRSPGLLGLRHDPALLRRAPATARARVGNLDAASRSRLLRINRHLRSCPLRSSWTLPKCPLQDRGHSGNIDQPYRRHSAEAYRLTALWSFHLFNCRLSWHAKKHRCSERLLLPSKIALRQQESTPTGG